MSDVNPGHRDAQQQQAGSDNGIADKVADDQGQQEGGWFELRAPPPLVIVLIVIPVITATVIVLLSRVVRFANNGSSRGVVVPKGVAVAGIATGRSTGTMTTILTVGPFGRQGAGDGAAPGGQQHLGTIVPAATAAGHPPPWLRPAVPHRTRRHLS